MSYGKKQHIHLSNNISACSVQLYIFIFWFHFQGLPGRSKATTDLASCSNTAIESTSQSSLSSSSSESLRIAAWEQNVKASSGAAYEKQTPVTDNIKATEVIDLTKDDDNTFEQSENNKCKYSECPM